MLRCCTVAPGVFPPAALYCSGLIKLQTENQFAADAATWLDRGLLGKHSVPAPDAAFGRYVHDAQARRRQWLIGRGFASEDGATTLYQRGLLSLTDRELQQTGDRLARERGFQLYRPMEGERISGAYTGSVQLANGKFAIIEKSHEFTLVPCQPVIKRS